VRAFVCPSEKSFSFAFPYKPSWTGFFTIRPLTQSNRAPDNSARSEVAELSPNVISNQITSRRNMKFRSSLALLALATLSLAPRLYSQAQQGATPHSDLSFHLVETTIDDIHQAYQLHLITPERLVHMYQARIQAYDGLNTPTCHFTWSKQQSTTFTRRTNCT
jgi:hypothetical protein